MNKVVIPVFPGTNCEVETRQWILKNLEVDCEFVSYKESFDHAIAVVVPGGFTYGDYLRVGALAARSRCMESVIKCANSGTPVLGICNGFQILCEAQLLPGALSPNVTGRHYHQIMDLNFTDVTSPWIPTRKKNKISLPISCSSGNYIGTAQNSFLLYDYNLLGSCVAGIAVKNILGLMPHPERASDPELGSTDGLVFLEGLSSALKLAVRKGSALAHYMNEGISP